MKVSLLPIAALIISGCATAPVGLDLAETRPGERSCQQVRANIDRLQNQLKSAVKVGEPAALSAPTLARQNNQLQAMRAAAAQENTRQSLVSELQFLRENCS